jgi:hypothetical protein
VSAAEAPVPFVPADPPESHDERFRIENTAQAEWAMRKLRRAREALTEVDAQAHEWLLEVEERRAQIVDWQQRASADDVRTSDRMTQLLWDYALRERARTGKATLMLPSGQVPTTHRGARPVIADEAAVVAWAKERGHGDAVKVTEKPLVSVLVGYVEPRRSVRAVLACGHPVEWVDPDESLHASDLEGADVPCAECGGAFVAVDLASESWQAVDGEGRPVPGVAVDPPRVDVGEVKLS